MNQDHRDHIIAGLPNFCGADAAVAEVMADRGRVSAPESLPPIAELRAVSAVALHMHQPLIPAGGLDLQSSPLISNLQNMMQSGDEYNAGVFADCYGRMGEIIPQLVASGKRPRVMLDYSGELLFGLAAMGRGDVLERLRGLVCDVSLRSNVEWLGTMWGHAVASATPLPDLRLHIRAWQQHFATLFGFEALGRVRGFSPPEMHLPNHPDAAYEYVKALVECGYRWMLVQEHTIEGENGNPLAARHLPHRLVARNGLGEEVSIVAVIKTQGSDTKLVGQMQPFYEAQTLQPQSIGGIAVPPIVTQIGDGENGGVMMNEFPSAFRQAVERFGTNGVTGVNVTEYLEMIAAAGVRPDMLPVCRPKGQCAIFSRIKKYEPGALGRAIDETKRAEPGLSLEGGSWTNDISWVRGYENVLTPMNRLSARFHQVFDGVEVDRNGSFYRNTLFHLLVSQTSCFRYWGQGAWTDYGTEICRRGESVLAAGQ